MNHSQDALDLLLPDADHQAVLRARNVTRFLRLLSDDAQPGRSACTVGVDLDRARTELERADRADLECALVDLLRHHLAAACDADSFAWFGEPVHDLRSAWRVLFEFEIEQEWITSVPAPGESTASVAARLLANLERLEIDPRRLDLWRARGVHALEGAVPAERLFKAGWRAFSTHVHSSSLARAFLAGHVECLLDRAHVREAKTLLHEHQSSLGSDARLRQLLSWSRLALGDASGARAALVGLRPWSGPIPASLGALRDVRPDWLPCLAGRLAVSSTQDGTSTAAVRSIHAATSTNAAPVQGSEAAPSSCAHSSRPTARSEGSQPLHDRHELGASVLCAFVFRPGVGAQALHVDVAPGLRDRTVAWLREREDAGFSNGSPEQRAIAEARCIVEHAGTGEALRHALGSPTTRATALAPVLDDEGEVAGWLHLECEHHLVPGQARLEHLSRGWARSVLTARDRGGPELATSMPTSMTTVRSRPAGKATSSSANSTLQDSTTSASTPAAATSPLTLAGPCARVFGDLVASIGFKLHQRLWTGFSLESRAPEGRGLDSRSPEGSAPVCVARGGEGVGFERDVAGRGRALARAVATNGIVTFDAPDERLSLHAQAGSGFVVPLRVENRACGFLSFESSRRRDFKPKDVEACARAAESAGLALRVAQMCAWHAERFRFEPWFDVAREDFRAFASHLLVAARSQSTVVLSGPPGVGKLVLARWIHFESADPTAPFKVHTCGEESGEVRAGLRACFQSARGGTLVLDDVDRLSACWQEELLRALEGVERAADATLEPDLPARIVATTSGGLGPAKDAGRLRSDLAARLDRLTLLVPALRERREEIPALVAAMGARFADEEDCAVPRFNDEAIALLWRQPWIENLRGLENVVYKIVLLHSGEEVRPEQVMALRRRFGLELVRKLPSRHPDRRDIVAALRSTRLAGGRMNKTRAAMYLGWDPDTLVARMGTERVDEEQLAALDAWSAEARLEEAEPGVEANGADA